MNPGPWKLSDVEEHIITDSNGHSICTYHVSRATRAADFANAQLIAAAPDLLNVCKRLLVDILMQGEAADAVHVRMLKNVIASAEGRY